MIRLLVVAVLSALTLAADEPEKLEYFEKHVRPVLSQNCFECHGSQKQESGIRLDHINFINQVGDFGPILIPGKPEESNLYKAVAHKSEDLMMPYEKEKLQQYEIDALYQWITDGAVWPDEPLPSGASTKFDIKERINRLPWIWSKPTRYRLPGVKFSGWPTSEIDFFVIKKLEEAGLKPANQAAPEVWLRRVHFAITGLPPTPTEIQDFLKADPSVRKESVVDALLDSPHFGERWARHWMDLVRYAESRGHESDFPIANAWHYRDYLIRAFNNDVPYDVFLTEHLAGDLIQQPRLHPQTGANESVLATGWPFFGEEVHSPVDIRQDENDRTDNKVDVLSKTFLGLTVACARCHDHKFDAISQKDYYSLTGYILSSRFRQVRFESIEHNQNISNKLESLRNKTRVQLMTNLETFMNNLEKNPSDSPNKNGINAWEPQQGSKVVINFDDPRTEWFGTGLLFGRKAIPAGQVILPRSAQALSFRLAESGHAARDPFWNGLKLRSGNQADSGNLDAIGRSAGAIQSPTFTVSDGRIHILMQGEAKIYAGVDTHLMLAGPLHGKLIKVLKTNEKKWVVYNLSEYKGHRVHLEFGPVADKDLKVWAIVDGPVDQINFKSPSLDIFEIFGQLTSGKSISTSQAQALNRAINKFSALYQNAPNDWMKKNKEILNVYHKSRFQLQNQIQKESFTAISLSDGNGINEYVLGRGKYQRPKGIAKRGLPSAFGVQLDTPKNGSGRLALAEALVSRDNPLVSRVFVNRIWHHIFGRGIVSSVDNFGWLGERPTHPELLDHLAWTFMHEDQWSIKSMIRRLVLSETFAMSSQPNDERAESVDPKNQLLHRMPVRRLEAEVIRDSVLAVSGRLDSKVYGRPVPVHLTEFVVGRGRPGKSGPLDGEGRRSIYTSVRRNFLPTMMLAFDTPIPFSTVGRRNVTNVPAQLLAMMNDKFVYQQAEEWAKYVNGYFSASQIREKIEFIYLQAFARKPSSKELELALNTIRELSELHEVPQSDIKVWRDMCHTFFRLNEFIYLR